MFLALGGFGVGEYDGVSMSMDLFPTILDIAGVDPDDFELDGVSILNEIDSTETIDLARYWRFGNQKAIRSGKWKYHNRHGNRFLFNLSDDPSESVDISDINTEIADSLHLLLEKWDSDMDLYKTYAK